MPRSLAAIAAAIALLVAPLLGASAAHAAPGDLTVSLTADSTVVSLDSNTSATLQLSAPLDPVRADEPPSYEVLDTHGIRITGVFHDMTNNLYRFWLQPQPGFTGTGSITFNPAKFTSHGAQITPADPHTLTFDVDGVRPTATITLSRTTFTPGQTAVVTITTSEPVTGLSALGLHAQNGTLGAVNGSGTTWTTTFSPNAGLRTTASITLDQGRMRDLAGNAGSGTATSPTYAIHTTVPTASIGLSDDTLTIGQTATATITFSEPVTGFTVDDLTIPHATGANLSSADGGTTWTLTITPDPDTEARGQRMTLDRSGVTNAVGTRGAGSITSSPYTVDTIQPMLATALELSTTTLTSGQTGTLTATFTEPVTGLGPAAFSAADVTFSAVSSSDGGTTWTATMTPHVDRQRVAVVVGLDQSQVRDLAGNAGSGYGTSPELTVDTAAPTATVHVPTGTITGPEQITVRFSEPTVGLSAAAFTMSGTDVTITDLASADGGITWTATLTPAPDTQTTGQLVVDLADVRDLAGNTTAHPTTDAPVAIDTRAPTATLTAPAGTVTAPVDITVVFSEPVTGLSAAALNAPGAAISDVATTDGGTTWTATLTPHADTELDGATLTVDLTSVRDAAGNPGIGTATSAPFDIDTLAPTATITGPAGTLTGATTLTIAFTEPVTGLQPANLSAEHGTLSDLATLDGGTTWTVTFTPDTDVAAGATIGIDPAGITDAAGNAATGTATLTLSINTVPVPTPTPSPGPAPTPAPSTAPAITPAPTAGPAIAPASTAAPTARPTASAQLPSTGTNPVFAGGVAGTLLAAGALLVVATRRSGSAVIARRP